MLEINLGMLPMHSGMDCMQSGILSRMSMPIGKMWDLIISCPLNYLHNIVEKLGANIITILNSTDCQFQIDCIYYIYWPNCALIVEPKEYLSFFRGSSLNKFTDLRCLRSFHPRPSANWGGQPLYLLRASFRRRRVHRDTHKKKHTVYKHVIKI